MHSASASTVLVIDDDRPSGDLLTAYLDSAGFNVELAVDGPTGLDLVRQHSPAAIVLDIRLPGMDGWQVLRRLKADPATTDIPVIIVSIVDERTEGLSLGAADTWSNRSVARCCCRPWPRPGCQRYLGPPSMDRGGERMSNRRRILVVEDNELNLKLVRDVLSHAGFEVIEARSGEDGVARAADSQPDLVLMDLQLPGIDGAEALELIRTSDSSRRVPVVAVTAFAMRADRDRALRAGFDGYVEKPISVRDLPRHVRQFLEEEGHDD